MLLLALFMMFPQQQPQPSQKPSTGETSSAPVDAKLHADVLTYLRLTGTEKRMRDVYPQSIDDAHPAMERQCPKCTPEFYVEFKKRMIARYEPMDCVNAASLIYEKYFSDSEMVEFIKLQTAQNANQPLVPSDELKAHLTSVYPTMMPEIIGKCSEIGAKLGAQVGTEISKEHPEYTGEPAKP